MAPRSPIVALLLLAAACSPVDPSPEGTAAAEEQAAVQEAEPTGDVTRREPLVHVSIPEKLTEGSGRYPADWSFDLVVRKAWSVHVHVVPQGLLVPPHHHPDNDELVWMAAGEAEWTSWTKAGRQKTSLGTGHLAIAPKGAVHSVRNNQGDTLAAVVLQRPAFAQNRYLLPEEVSSDLESGPLSKTAPLPEGFLGGWSLEQRSVSDEEEIDPGPADILYFVLAGSGQIRFEAKTLPLEPGVFVKVPPGLTHRLRGGETVEVFAVRIPR
ncbi:MAG: cupin domain-containing protein [Myxococcota bacterium]|nr:cupin domain-containing protein [Myxococcota bacterium]